MSQDHIGRMHHRSPEVISDDFALQYNKDDIIVLPVLYVYMFRIKYFVHLSPVLQAFDRKTHNIHGGILNVT